MTQSIKAKLIASCPRDSHLSRHNMKMRSVLVVTSRRIARADDSFKGMRCVQQRPVRAHTNPVRVIFEYMTE